MPDLNSSSDRDPVERLAEEFAERHRLGEKPDINEYVERYPQWADQIRDLFPALLLMEQFKPEGSDRTGSYKGDAEFDPMLKQLGDYRILREVGRGGMGVVYEAEQVLLGRHVAVKVLPPHALDQPHRLQRFHREARAAARLHHTNIVPVFGVGEHQGHYYYVMQFIQGQGLNQVLSELAMMRKQPSRKPATQVATVERVSAAAIAEALEIGSFEAPVDAASPAADPLSPPATPAEDPVDSPPDETLPSKVKADHSTLADSGQRYWHSVARIGVQVANALSHAHSQKVLHRDIKPSNLLLDLAGVVWVTDFGLAKALDEEDGLTRSGDIVGTLRYLAPERLRGRGDARSDVYSLGLTLYEMLTLRPAFDARDHSELLNQVIQSEPIRPRKIDASVPRDLETIVLKAIDREPSRRYPTAADLADDLLRFLEDRPIQARRVTRREQVYRWCRRNPALATVSFLALAALLAVAVLSAIFAFTKDRDARHLAQAAGDLSAALADVRDEQVKTSEALGKVRAEQERTAAALEQSRRQAAIMAVERARSLIDKQEYDRALLWLTRGLEIAPPQADDLQHLIRCNLGALRVIPTGVHEPSKFPTIRDICAISPDARRLVAISSTQMSLRLMTLEPRGEVQLPCEGLRGSHHAEFSQDGLMVLLIWRIKEGAKEWTQVGLWDIEKGSFRGSPVRFEGNVLFLQTQVANGRFLQVCCKKPDKRPRKEKILIWETASGRLKELDMPSPATPTPSEWLGTTFAPDGRTMVNWNVTATQLYNFETQQQIGENLSHRPSAIMQAWAFSPDSKMLALGYSDGFVRLWDAQTGKSRPALFLRDPIKKLAFSPDSELLLIGYGIGDAYTRGNHRGEVRLYRVRDSMPLATPIRLSYPTNVLAFSPDQRTFLTASHRTLQFWDTTTCQPLAQPILHPNPQNLFYASFYNAVFATDGKSVLTDAGKVDVPIGAPIPRILLTGDAVSGVAYSREGRAVIVGNLSQSIRKGLFSYLWDADSCLPLKPMVLTPGETAATASSGGELFATVPRPGGPFIWDAVMGIPYDPPLHDATMEGIRAMAFSPDRTLLAAGSSPSHIPVLHVWNVRSGKRLGPFLSHPSVVNHVAFSPDSRLVLIGCADGTAQLLDAHTGRLVIPSLEHGGAVTSVAFRPDGKRALTASQDHTARLWEIPSGRLIFKLEHGGSVTQALFSPDGKRILTVSVDRTARLWDTASGQPIGMAWLHPDQVLCAAYSGNGRMVATGCADGMVRLWDADMGLPIGESLPHPQPLKAMIFSPDGRSLLTACVDDEAARLWDVPQHLIGDPERLKWWAQALSGLELDPQGTVRVLSSEEREERGQRLQAAGGSPITESDSPHAKVEEDRRIAMNCLYQQEWYAAQWHLERILALRPDDWSALVLRGRALVHQGRRDAAAADFARAYACGPADRVSAALIAQTRKYYPIKSNTYKPYEPDHSAQAPTFFAGRQTILWYLDQIIANWPADWRLYDVRADIHILLGQMDKAEQDYEAALKLRPQLSFFYDRFPLGRGWADAHGVWG